ncbi:MAG TPA: SDR family NAD(P)-dependent oxidoreductase [Thermoanaerobaculia bacterium]|jgi:NADP-dependent 3-hydroxy acid dehydrogenase YdfG
MEAQGKVIVITGASSGIGAALARRLGAAGHRLALGARREPELKQVASELGTDALAVVTDVTRRESVEHLCDEALGAFGCVDVWVNNAGRGISRPVLELTDADFDEMMAVNVKSALYGMQAIVPHFIARGEGHLINVSSFLGRVPLATHRSAYNAAKAALNALTANLRVDLRASHPSIHVSLVMPGLVSTGFARNALGSTGAVAAPPAGPMKPQTPEEVAAMIESLIEHPVAEIYTNPASPAMARRYFEDVEAFEKGAR